MLLLLMLNSSALLYSPLNSCSGDLRIPFQPPALDSRMTYSCVIATLFSPDSGDVLWGSQAPTSHADPCFIQGINWRDNNIVNPTALPQRLIYNATEQRLPLSLFAPCVATTTFRSTSSHPCAPFAWDGYFEPQTKSNCVDRLLPINSYISGERRVSYIAGLDPSDCVASTLDLALEPYSVHVRGSQIIHALPLLLDSTTGNTSPGLVGNNCVAT